MISKSRTQLPLSFFVILFFNGLQNQRFAIGETTSVKNINLSKKHVAVWFYPPSKDQEHPYKESNLKGVFHLVSSKFGAIAVDNAPLVPNTMSIENMANSVVSVPILVAEQNKNAKEEQQLQVMVSFDLSTNAYHSFNNLSNGSYRNSYVVAKYYADKANKIHPNTVDTLLMHHDDYLRVNHRSRKGYTFVPPELHSARESLNQSNASPNTTKYKLGMTISTAICGIAIGMGPKIEAFYTVLPTLVEHADLIIPIYYIGQQSNFELTPTEKHVIRLDIFNECEQVLKIIKPQIETIPFVICNRPTSSSLHSISNFLQCWQLMSDWAQKNNKKVIMFEAFDRHYEDPDYVGGVGWWRFPKDGANTANETLFWERAEVDFLPSTITTDGLKTISFDHRVRSRPTFYSERELIAMLKVITTRFPTIAIYQTQFLAGHNSSTNNTDVTRIPQLVAELNSERRASDSSSQPISVMLIVQRLHLDNEYSPLIMKALKVARNANKIFTDTVSTLVYDGIQEDTIDRDLSILTTVLNTTGNESLELGLRLGVVVEFASCRNINKDVFKPLTKWVKTFIFYVSTVTDTDNSNQDVSSRNFLRVIMRKAEKCKELILAELPGVEVMVQINCSAIALEDMAMCAHIMSKWGKENRVGVILSQAFDIPFVSGESDLVVDPNGGWWKLDENLEGDITIDSFKEKLAEYLEYPPSSEPTDYSFLIWIGVGIGLLLLLGLVIIQTIRLVEKQRLLSKIEVSEFHDGVTKAIIDLKNVTSNDFMKTKYDKKRFEIAKQDFKFGTDSATILGEGNYGVVYKLTVSRFPNPVAVKVPRSGCSKQAFQSHLSEIKIMSFIGENEHVIRFLGAYTREIHRGKVYIVTEHCEMGSLQSYLFKVATNRRENKTTQHNELVRFCKEIASGMKYIAEKGVIHGDLSARNVLLDKHLTCKITDFGLSKKLYQYQIYTTKQKVELPWRWLAIETLKRLEFSTKSDVWAYGVTVWEIFSLGDLPYPGMTWACSFVEQLENGMRMKRPEMATYEIHSKMVDCWNIEPDQRPSFHELMSFFSGLKRNEYV
ncbi:unnamed protein product [Orchesella dallaii]|uniref:Protein kinase domain-containing protein n=1 Tax=Orchesella dallaii TaxID=48710 RepID=A0ABP1S922_9HEXA